MKKIILVVATVSLLLIMLIGCSREDVHPFLLYSASDVKVVHVQDIDTLTEPAEIEDASILSGNKPQEIWKLINRNATWIFSGIGTSVGIAIFSVIYNHKKRSKRQAKIENIIVIKGNKNSKNSFDGANFGIITKGARDDKNKKDA